VKYDHTHHLYSPSRLSSKLLRISKLAGDKLIVTALTLYHCLQDTDTPAWARTIIIGALGYLILPADDWGVLVAALGAITMYVKDPHKQKAREQADRIFSLGKKRD
jgi:uncharacterized membrane protein YkvA (DUF1232 family)